jgi:hypothetical protein
MGRPSKRRAHSLSQHTGGNNRFSRKQYRYSKFYDEICDKATTAAETAREMAAKARETNEIFWSNNTTDDMEVKSFVDEYIEGGNECEGVYTGQLVNGSRNGHGVMRYTDGVVYDGQWKDNKAEGYGIYTSSSCGDVDVYEGQWKNDSIINGTHEETYSWRGSEVVDCYSGEFRDFQFNGYGVFTLGSTITEFGDEGYTYHGEFKDDDPDGHGVFVYNNKDEYYGEVKEGLSHGHGVLRWPAEFNRPYEGTFVNGDVQFDGDRKN